MGRPITAFLPYSGQKRTLQTVNALRSSGLVGRVFLLATESALPAVPGAPQLRVPTLHGSDTACLLGAKTATSYALFLLHDTALDFGAHALERLVQAARMTGGSIVYSDYYDLRGDARTPHPVIDYQTGSLRDDFNFGSLLLLEGAALRDSRAELEKTAYRFAGWYALRLSLAGIVVELPDSTAGIKQRERRRGLFPSAIHCTQTSSRRTQVEEEKCV